MNNNIKPQENLKSKISADSHVLAFFNSRQIKISLIIISLILGGILFFNAGRFFLYRAEQLVEAGKILEAIQCLKMGAKINNINSSILTGISITNHPYYAYWHMETEFLLAELYNSLAEEENRNNRFYAEESNKWFHNAYDHEYGPALFKLASHYLNSGSDQTKRILGIALLHKAAEKGCLDAQYNLGMYYYIYGNPQDHSEAAQWLKAVASYGRENKSRPNICFLAADALELLDYYSYLAQNLKDNRRYQPNSGYSIPIKCLDFACRGKISHQFYIGTHYLKSYIEGQLKLGFSANHGNNAQVKNLLANMSKYDKEVWEITEVPADISRLRDFKYFDWYLCFPLDLPGSPLSGNISDQANIMALHMPLNQLAFYWLEQAALNSEGYPVWLLEDQSANDKKIRIMALQILSECFAKGIGTPVDMKKSQEYQARIQQLRP